MNLTKNFTYEELTFTNSGLENNPNKQQFERLVNGAKQLELVRTACGNRPVTIKETNGSGFRSPEVNNWAGGAVNSAHLDGDAFDICITGLTNKQICELIIKSGIRFDQLIDENKGGRQWVHISFAPALRMQYLVFSNGKYEVHK